ncbi:hypothetical protein [Roseateles sp.]|uniref:hypothetical protein n=1 Tax=Roseateles sp. TaxID=1971397 RepID=UPI0031DE94A3
MKVRITHMKAPWPSGASVGQVVAFEGGEIAGWARGKCVPVGDDEEVNHTVAASREVVMTLSVDSAEVQEAFHGLRQEDLRRIEEAKAAFEAERQSLLAENASLRDLLAARDQLVADLQAKLAAGPTGGGDGTQQAGAERAALEAEAKALGVEFAPQIGDKALADRIAKKKAETK